MKNIILYGTGLEGEKFFCRFKNDFDILYCIDRRKRNAEFHGRQVFCLEEKEAELRDHLIVVATTDNAWREIRKNLLSKGLNEYSDFINANALGKKIVVVYGNCHMRGLCEYLRSNYFFQKDYYINYYYIGECECPDSVELERCSVLISQDINEDNKFHMPGSDMLCKQLRKGARKIIIPNLYGCNLFFLQCYFPLDNQLQSHLESEAIDIDTYNPIEAQRMRVAVESIGKRDFYIDESYQKGCSIDEIKYQILNGEVWKEKDILGNFCHQMKKLREREKKCDIKISDYIDQNYQQVQLFYEPFHPTETVIAEKGRRILELLQIPQDEEIQMRRTMDAMEMPIYGCVKEALGLQFNQNIFRRNCSATLTNKPENLDEYVVNYLAWVYGGGV